MTLSMPAEDKEDLLSLFSGVPEGKERKPAGAPERPASTATYTPPPAAAEDSDDLSLLSDLNDLFGAQIDTAKVAEFQGPSEEQLARAAAERARLHAQASSVQAPPPPAAAAEDEKKALARLEEEM